MNFKKKVKALGLSSGGLDSILAALVLQKQGITVQWIAIETPFFSSENAKKASKATGISLITEDVTEQYLKMLKAPNAGYGKNMNPCMDCHSLMFKVAGQIMEKIGFDFLFSGEVVGQRPKSQNKNSLRYVEKHSGFNGKILRPLSAKLLPETSFEKDGLVDREKLLDISGRSRKIQIALADKYGIKEFPAPAGGCCLTDKGFSNRLRDLFGSKKLYSKNDLYLLHHGRHFRWNKDVKIIVGRNQKDNENIFKYYDKNKDILIKTIEKPGPIVLVLNNNMILQDINLQDINLQSNFKTVDSLDYIKDAVSICTGYSKLSKGATAMIQVNTPVGEKIVTGTGGSIEGFKKFLL